MSRNYEMMYVLRPDLSEEQTQNAIAKYNDLLTELGGSDIQADVWGRRRLAYPIQKFQDGIYVLLRYTAEGQQVAPLERAMRLGEEVIRYLTIKLDKKAAEASEDATEPEAVEA
ncbi:MAG: 30S ribosomal protein S6 [Cyanobacteria bacterium P01_G01_bin.54]